MTILANILIALTALLHAGFLVLEMFLWTGPQGRKVFRMTAEQAEATKGSGGKSGALQWLSRGRTCLVAHRLAAGICVPAEAVLPCVRDRCRYIWRMVGQAAHSACAGRTGDPRACVYSTGILIYGDFSSSKDTDHPAPVRPAWLLRRRRPGYPDRRSGAEGIRRAGLCPPRDRSQSLCRRRT